MKRLLTVVCLVFALTPNLAYSDIVMNIWDDGVNLYMSATGTYDLTNASSAGSISLGANAAVAPSFPIFGWETGTATQYNATYSGFLTGTLDVYPATSTTTTIPFFFYQLNNTIVMSGGLTGTVNEFATFSGVTLASLGMVGGETINVRWGLGGINEGGSISTSAVPEPTSLLIGFTLGLVGLVNRRRRVV